MIKSMFSAVTGLKSHQTMMDVIGNNIANVNTNGFKSSRVLFTDVYYQTLSEANAATDVSGGTNPSQIGYGSKVSSIDVLNTRSGYQQTNRTMDFYISGDGYFVLDDGTGTISYSRVGDLKFDTEGNLIDGNGSFVYGQMPKLTEGGTMAPIKIANFKNYTQISISENGMITGIDSTSTTGEIEELGQIGLAYFVNQEGLSQSGNMYYKETVSSGKPSYSTPGSAYTGSLVSGGLELSNVDLSTEFTNMIIAQRGLQANSRVITTSDQILEELVNLKR